MITKEDIVKINKRFDKGNVVNSGALDFALSSTKHSKDWLTQAAYLIRAILIDHVFEEGNKRTAAALLYAFYEDYNKAYDIYKIDKIITGIVTKNITDIAKIRRMIKDAVR